MKKTVLLPTKWEQNYWESDKEAPYKKFRYDQLPEWGNLSQNCPLPGLGIYYKRGDEDFNKTPFVYLKITCMRFDLPTKQPYFTIEFIKKSKNESQLLYDKLSLRNRGLFCAIESEKLKKALNDIGEDPPQKWKDLTEIQQAMNRQLKNIFWEDYIGKYFLEIEDLDDYNDFEDRVAKLLCALGFEVDQQGYKRPGSHPDGVASFDDDDYVIVYDCKNTDNFIATEDDKLKIRDYIKSEERLKSDSKIYGVFIAKRSRTRLENGIFYFSTGSLIDLLYKKLILGSRFTLTPFRNILEDPNVLEEGRIDLANEWR